VITPSILLYVQVQDTIVRYLSFCQVVCRVALDWHVNKVLFLDRFRQNIVQREGCNETLIHFIIN
jgi:hypothetical protein